MVDTRGGLAGTVRRFDTTGYLVLGQLEPPLLATLRRAVDATGGFRRSRSALHQLSCLHRYPELASVIDWPPLLAVVVEILSTNIYVHHSHLDVHPPHPPTTGQRWHRDGGVQGREMRLMPADQPRLGVKVGVFLTDVARPDDGALELVPGSHRDLSTRRQDQPVADGVALAVPAGTVVLFDARVWHRRRDNLGTRTRRALFLAYTYRWIASREDPPDHFPGWADQSPLRRQLLGDRQWEAFYPAADGLPLDEWMASRRSSRRPPDDTPSA